MNILKYFIKTNKLFIISFLILINLTLILTIITNLYLVNFYYLTIFPSWVTYTKQGSYFFGAISIIILFILTFKTFFSTNRNFIIKFWGKKKYLIFLFSFNVITFILIFLILSLIIYTVQMRFFVFHSHLTSPSLYFQLINCLDNFKITFIWMVYINTLLYILLISKEFYKNSKYKYYSLKKRTLKLIAVIMSYVLKISLLSLLIIILTLSDNIFILSLNTIFPTYVPINNYLIISSITCMLFIIFLDYTKYFLDEIYI